MVKINLLAEGRRPVIARKAKLPLLQVSGANVANYALIGAILIGLAASLTWYLVLESQVKKKDHEIQIAQKEVDELRQVIQEVQAYEKQLKELHHKIDVITALKNNQRGPVEIMDQVSKALPDLTWLTSMEVFANVINLRGTAFNMSAVANFIDNLDKVPAFKEPVLRDATRAGIRGRGGEVYNFRLSLGYSFAPPPQADKDKDASSPAGASSRTGRANGGR